MTTHRFSFVARSVGCAVLVTALVACAGGAPDVGDGGPQGDGNLEARARGIHDRVVTLDTHKDISENFTPTDGSEGEDPGVRGNSKVDLHTMRSGGLDVVFFVVYVGQDNGSENGGLDAEGYADALAAAMRKFEGIHRMTDEVYSDQIGLATSPGDVKRLVAEGKLVAAIGVENGYPMGEDLSLIEQFADLGAGYMGITHNGHNQLGDSQTPGWAGGELHGGLSELGRQAVAEMNKWGIMVDVSHAGKQTMMEVLEVSQAPVIASHSSVYFLRDHGRNLDDEQLMALQENGGVVQLVALGNYVKDTSERLAALEAAEAEPDARMPEIDAQFPPVNVQDFVDHVDYAVNLIGIDHVAISSDFDGGGGIEGWDGAAETFNVTLEMVRRGYSEEEVAKLWSGNTLRVWQEVKDVAQRIQAGEGW